MIAGHTVLDMLMFAIIFVLVFLPLSYFHLADTPDPVCELWDALRERL